MFGSIISFMFVLVTTITAQNAKFLAEKPASMVPCTLENSKVCLAKNLEVIFREFKDGLPGLNTISGTDPLLNEGIVFRGTDNAAININVELTNVKIIGASAAKISNVNANLKENILSYDITVPKLSLTGDYKGNGTLLGFTIQSSGKVTGIGENIVYKVSTVNKPRYENKYTFFDVEKFKGTLVNLDNVRLKLDNLFNGQKDLEDALNIAINDNWREFYEAMYPNINDSFRQAFEKHFRAYLSFIPMQYLLNGVPNSA